MHRPRRSAHSYVVYVYIYSPCFRACISIIHTKSRSVKNFIYFFLFIFFYFFITIMYYNIKPKNAKKQKQMTIPECIVMQKWNENNNNEMEEKVRKVMGEVK